MKKKADKLSVPLKIILVLAIMALAGVGIYCVSFAAATVDSNVYPYAYKHSQVQSEEFVNCRFDGFDDLSAWSFSVSRDKNKDNEVFIFKPATFRLRLPFGYLSNRNKFFMTASSKADVGSLLFSVVDENCRSDAPQTFLLYYSNNKMMAYTCTYQFIKSDETCEKTLDCSPYYPFSLLIPCGEKGSQEEIKIIKASFYDKDGNLVYEDIRG
ncbi:MAG: hypothetical protein PUC33_02500 [Oscillospiraceae bacterium]|nr:hypothetical protein [Oscillospiraceae bacterium]